MDVNGNRFHFINTAVEWSSVLKRSGGENMVWDANRLGAALQAENFRFPPRQGEAPLNADAHRGAAYDRYGAVYWVDEDRQTLWFYPASGIQAAVFWNVQDWQQQCSQAAQHHDGAFHAAPTTVVESMTSLCGLAITCNHYLLVGTHEPGGLLVFDLHSGGEPMWMLWPAATDFYPRDICVAQKGHVFILDSRQDGMPAQIWQLDHYFRVLDTQTVDVPVPVSVFQPASVQTERGAASDYAVQSLSDKLALQTGLKSALAIESLPDGSVLVLETAHDSGTASRVHRYVEGNKVESLPLQVVTDVDDDILAPIRAYDFLFVADERQSAEQQAAGTLYICEQMGNQVYAFQVTVQDDKLSLELMPHYYPMHSYAGVALATNGKHVYYNMQQRWLPLVSQPQRRFASQGEINSIVLDSEQTACVWHRIILDACIPDDTEIRVRSRAAEKREWLINASFNTEPLPYFRQYGSELAQELPHRSPQTADKNGSWELLLQNARGRYIEICMEFKGNGRSSPLLRAMRVYYPRFSYLQEYLPAVYQDDTISAHFLDRYLANAEGLFTEMEGRIAHVEHLFDSRSTSSEFLQWLAGWLGVVFDPQWDDQRRRLFLRYVPLLYRWRGTLEGLRAMIAMAISPCPDERLFVELERTAGRDNTTKQNNTSFTSTIRIVEHFQLRSFSALALGGTDNQDFSDPRENPHKWNIRQDVAALHALYKAYLQNTLYAQKLMAFSEADYRFPVTLPRDEELAQVWRVFLQHYVDFPYAVLDRCNAVDTRRYREFLARHYPDIHQMNQAYGLSSEEGYSGFHAVLLPEFIPTSDQALEDWLKFVSVVMPVKRNAGKFTVLVPAWTGEESALRQQRLEKTQQLVLREKPAHTDFEVKLYWALFRAGSARLGIDSIIGEGSRYTAMILNQEYLAQSYLAAAYPFTINDRYVTGRDRLQEV